MLRHPRAAQSGIRRAMRLPISVAAVAFALILGAPTARADVIYQYTGNFFNTFSGASNPYTTGDYVHGSFSVASALAPNLVGADLSGAILSFVFNDFADEHAAITSAPPGGFYLAPQISTDAAGNITYWRLAFSDGHQTHFISTFSIEGMSGDFNLDVGNANAQNGPAAWNIGSPGTWSSSASTVPEPSGLVLLCTGIAVVGASFRRS